MRGLHAQHERRHADQHDRTRCDDDCQQLSPTTTTTTLVGQEGPTSTVDQSSGAATTTDPIGRTLPATGNGGRTANLTVIALTLVGIGAVMLRLASKPNR